MPSLFSFLILLAGASLSADELINPVPRPAMVIDRTRWDFEQGTDGWAAQNRCRLSAEGGLLKVEALGHDPFFHCRVDLPSGQFRLRMKARGKGAGGCSVYWTTSGSPRGEDKVVHFALRHDNQWHEYETSFPVDARLTDVRLDPGSDVGAFDIDWIELIREELHPLTIDRAETLADLVRFHVTNHRESPLEFSALGKAHSIAAGGTATLDMALKKDRPLESVTLALTSAGLPEVRRTIWVHHPQLDTDWLVRKGDGFELRIARDGSVARIERGGQLLAIFGPLVHRGERLPALRLVEEQPRVRFEGDDLRVLLSVSGPEIRVSIQGSQRWTGPVVRVGGGLEQGLLAGLEYLGKGERSSTKLDVETEEHLRFAPDPLKVTMPLMAFVTDKASVAMHWNDMSNQPLYATPNFFDCTPDHYMALEGDAIEATLRVDQAPLEEAILWAVRKDGLPPLPESPRSSEAQWALCLQALNGPLKTAEGWGHCVEPNWERRPFAPMASTIWRLTGEILPLPNLATGGSHVDNDSIYFVTGRADQWLERRRREIQNFLRAQQPDGSYRYDGTYRRGHFENTASGVCARPAAELLEYAWMTGDENALKAGLRTLDYMQRFRTPRGAQVWEVPLHTPDQLASAHLVTAYVHGYQLTNNPEYLRSARKWALSGVPFVYLWGRYPVMLYGTPPVFGSTHWKGTCWLGRPVQWVGGVYAYALTQLAPYDDALDWNHLARGILIAAEQMQYPDGPNAGLLPDAFDIAHQQRVPANINPCALVSLRFMLDGQLDSLAVATDGKHRVVAPFPVTLQDGYALIQGQRGLHYQILLDGQRVIDVESQGLDRVPLD